MYFVIFFSLYWEFLLNLVPLFYLTRLTILQFYRLDGSRIDNSEVDGSEVEDDEVGKKG